MAESLEELVPCGFSLLLPSRRPRPLSAYAAAAPRHALFLGELAPLLFIVRYAGRGQAGALLKDAASSAARAPDAEPGVGDPLSEPRKPGVDEDDDDDDEDERDTEEAAFRAAWRRIAPELRASAGVTAARADRRDGGDEAQEVDEEEVGDEEEEGRARRSLAPGFRQCAPLLLHGDLRPEQMEEEEREVLPGEVVFSLRVSLDKLPVGTTRAKLTVTVWSQEREFAELRSEPFLRLLQHREPTQLFRTDSAGVRTQVSSWISILPPPSLSCRQINVAGQHMTAIRVHHAVQAAPVCLQNVRVLPDLNTGYLPMMPDGSMMLADNTCRESGDVGMASLLRLDCPACVLPVTLGPLETAAFLFALRPPPAAAGGGEGGRREGLEVPLLVTLHWTSPAFPIAHSVYTHYRLPSVKLSRPRLVLLARCPPVVSVRDSFSVSFTLLNQLQDFLSVRLVWAPDGGGEGGPPFPPPVVCHTPTTHLGFCARGSTLSFPVGFQVLRAGLYELSQQMKLKLQFTASSSQPPASSSSSSAVGGGGSGGVPPTPLSLARTHSPSSPVVRDLQQTGIGRSQSFSHQQQPRNGHFVRSGSVMERRAITPPVPSPRPLPAGCDRAVLCLDTIAKRSCQVLALEPGAS